MSRKRIGIDLDNTLCKGEHWKTEKACLGAKPIKRMIDITNKLYKHNFIIIYTARQDWLMTATFEWLHENNVHFHAVANGKIPLDFLIDDTAQSSYI
jgi:uncharacterized HAD superfamily protein